METLQILEVTLPTPAENIAADEALLDVCERIDGGGVLRIWESSVPFVVVGYGNHVAHEVDLPACLSRQIPIVRRCTGGGTVLQGPGSWNYSLILRAKSAPALENITGTNHFVMERSRSTLEKLLGVRVEIQGHTDLAIDGRKVSGNAQRRKKSHLLFHGTVLLSGFDLPLLGAALRFPPRAPKYRQERTHQQFVRTLNLDRQILSAAFRAVWDATIPWGDAEAELFTQHLQTLVRDRYANDAWNFRF